MGIARRRFEGSAVSRRFQTSGSAVAISMNPFGSSRVSSWEEKIADESVDACKSPTLLSLGEIIVFRLVSHCSRRSDEDTGDLFWEDHGVHGGYLQAQYLRFPSAGGSGWEAVNFRPNSDRSLSGFSAHPSLGDPHWEKPSPSFKIKDHTVLSLGESGATQNLKNSLTLSSSSITV